jgi:sigma-B regulation protein RsbU (phosphoserine phosphatase)
MARWNVAVLSFEGDEAMGEAVRDGLISSWRSAPVPSVTCHSADAVEAERMAHLSAAVLIAARPIEEGRVLRLLSLFEECDVPVLSLVDAAPAADNPHELAGALVSDLRAPSEVNAALLHGLLHRQRHVLRMRHEAALAQRFQGGVSGEMARIHEELQLASIIQRDLLPRELPRVHGVEFGVLWRPVNYVSGDIYEVVRLDEDHVGLFLADAVGHGVPAALMTMVLCQSLRPMEQNHHGWRLRPPSEVLAQLNQAMIHRQSGHTRFATAVYGVLDCRSRVLTIAGAGHPHPLLVSADGSCTEIKTQGGLLGVFPDEPFDQIEVEVALGDRLVFFSDGFEQAFPHPGTNLNDRRLPTARYRREIERLALAGTAEGMIEQLSASLDEQRGSLHQVDDLTLICANAGPLEQPGAYSGAAPQRDAVSATMRR